MPPSLLLKKERTMATLKTFYNVSNRTSFDQQLAAGNIPSTAIAFIKDSREIWAKGVFYPCDFSAAVLPAAPTSSTLTYVDNLGYVRGIRPGQACVYPSADMADGYGIAFLKSVSDGKAVWQDLGAVLSTAAEALAFSEEANAYAKAAYTNSNEAVSTANVAKNAVAALEGLSNTTTAQQTLAAQVTQITQNSSDVALLKEKHVVMTEEEYAALELVDQEKIYMLYEE